MTTKKFCYPGNYNQKQVYLIAYNTLANTVLERSLVQF